MSLADTLVEDFDLLDFLGKLAEKANQHLDVAAAAVILSDQRGGWQPTAASHEQAELVALFTTQTHDGPCLDCVHSGSAVTSPDLHTEQRWPAFTHQALQAGYQAAAAVPLRSRQQIIGSLTLLGTEPDGLEHASIELGQALADMATIGLLQQRASRQEDLLAGQLQAALHHRVVIEQAKGVLAETDNLAPETAYTMLRDHARQQGQHLSELARELTTGTIRAHEFLATADTDTTSH